MGDAAAGHGWHGRLRHIRGSGLSADTAQTPGMRRFVAISGASVGSAQLWMGRTHVQPGATSGNHHHGAAETAIYVVSGHPVFVFLEDGQERAVRACAGDFVFVPPYAPHREENPGADEAVVVIARSTQEAIVVNLPELSTGPA